MNWYWRSNFKFVLNYVMVDSEKYIGSTSATYAGSGRTTMHVNDFLATTRTSSKFASQLYW